MCVPSCSSSSALAGLRDASLLSLRGCLDRCPSLRLGSGLELLLEVVDHLIDDRAGRMGTVLANAAGLARDPGHELWPAAKELYVANELLHRWPDPPRAARVAQRTSIYALGGAVLAK